MKLQRKEGDDDDTTTTSAFIAAFVGGVFAFLKLFSRDELIKGCLFPFSCFIHRRNFPPESQPTVELTATAAIIIANPKEVRGVYGRNNGIYLRPPGRAAPPPSPLMYDACCCV